MRDYNSINGVDDRLYGAEVEEAKIRNFRQFLIDTAW